MQLGAVSEYDFLQAARRGSCLRLVRGNGNYIARLQGSLAPADQHKRLRSSRLNHPMLHFALVILRIELN